MTEKLPLSHVEVAAVLLCGWGLFLDQDYPTTGFPPFFTLEISVFWEFVQMVFHIVDKNILMEKEFEGTNTHNA